MDDPNTLPPCMFTTLRHVYMDLRTLEGLEVFHTVIPWSRWQLAGLPMTASTWLGTIRIGICPQRFQFAHWHGGGICSSFVATWSVPRAALWTVLILSHPTWPINPHLMKERES
jgi:hypothetical protein